MANNSQISRLVYIEPNDLATNGEALDNVTWNLEDLNIGVDLQVIIPDRNYTGHLGDSNNYQFSVSQKEGGINRYNSFFGGTTIKGQSLLTDNYISASYIEIKNGRCGSNECLGIKDIKIEFSEYFYPKITMTFLDVRGMSAIASAEEEYVNGLKNNERLYTNLYRALFHYPYPRFLLSVKGFFGTKVTFDLSVNDVKAALNSESGNFDVTVQFIGYMYGLYTDIPMNMLIISPYIDSLNNTVGSYWRENPNFTLTNGKHLPTLIDFAEKFVRVAEEISKDSNNVNDRAKLNEYIEVKNEINALDGLRESINAYYDSFTEINKDAKKIDGDTYYIITTKSDKIMPSEKSYNTAVKVNSDVVDKYGKKYDFSDCISTVSWQGIELSDDFIINSNGIINKNAHDYDLISSDKTLVTNIENSYKLIGGERFLLLKHNGASSKIANIMNDLTVKLNKLTEEAANEIKTVISDKLGFEPTVHNIFRILFAHIDTFMHFMYEDTLEAILKQQKSGTRIKVDSLSANGNGCDIDPRHLANVEVPPFPGVYRTVNGEKTFIYPYEYPTMPEVSLVERMVSSAVAFRTAINSVTDYAAQTNAFNETNNSTERFKMSFLPTCLNDLSFSGANPYSCLTNKGDDVDSIGELLYMYVLRYLGSSYSTKLEMNIPMIEACNYKLFKVEISDNFKNVFLNRYDNTEFLKKALNDFISRHKDQLILNLKVEGDNVCLDGTNQRIPLHFRTVYINGSGSDKAELSIEDYSADKDVGSVFKILPKGEKDRLSEFTNINDALNIVLKYWNTEEKIITSINDVHLTGEPTYFVKNYPKHPISKSRLYQYSEAEPEIVLASYSKKEPPYSDDVKSLYDTRNFEDYRMPFIGFNDSGNNFFGSKYIKNVQKSKYAKALIFLSCFPFNDYNRNRVIYHILGENINYGSDETYDRTYGGQITAFPRFLVLYVAGLLYREKYIEEHKTDLIADYPSGATLANGYEIRGEVGFHIPENGKSGTASDALMKLNELSDAEKTVLINYFKDWADTEFYPLYKECTTGGAHLKFKKDKDGLWQCEDLTVQRKLMKFYIDEVYVFKNSSNKDKLTVPINNLSEFVRNLGRMYSTTTASDSGNGSFNKSDVSTEMKLSCYRTLKNLYDRWLPSYTMNNFRLPSCEEEIVIKTAKLDGNNGKHGGKNDKNEFCKFFFVDCYYNDIGDDYMINPKILYDMILECANSEFNYSAYQFMSDLLQKNKMLLMALPVFNNYYDIDSIRDIFTPHQQYSPKNRLSSGLGSTYIGMYAYDMSRNLNYGSDSSKCFDNDGMDLADTLGNIGQISNGNSLQLFEYKNGKMNINVPAFGVTFARQNQTYFKRITINSEDSRATDYGIFNTLELSKLGGKGFTDEPFAVGQDIFSIFSNRSYTCTIEMMGCANIMPMMYFQLNNIPMFKGAYMITKVSHNITPGNMTTTFTGVRVNRNQLPFNKDIFNINSFTALVEQFSTKNV